MRISYEWLKELIEYDLEYEELINTLTMIGLESEKAEKMQCEFDSVVVGKIVKLKKKEQGHIATIDIGKSEYPQVYCTAPNVKVGILAPYAPPDAVIKGIKVESKSFGDFISNGILCSASELGIGRDSFGILLLGAPLKVGDNLKEYLFGDLPIEIEIVSNRGDLYSFLGIARELAVHLKGKVRNFPVLDPHATIEGKHGDMGVVLKDPDLCPLYTYRMIENVEIKDSPTPLLRKLISLGLKPINNIVDITNIVLYEIGQPLHPFDRANLKGAAVIIRRANQKEHFKTLDDIDRELSENDLLIADESGGIALGGVMGGLLSEINWNTKDVLLESALFNKINIRRTSRRHVLRTDASIRFERGVDPDMIVKASSRVMWYVKNLKIGKPSQALVYGGQLEYPKRTITVRIPRIEGCLGYKIPVVEMKRILQGLGFKIAKGTNKTLELTVPGFRADVEIEEDVAEELARHYGYNLIASSLPRIVMGRDLLHPYDRLKYRMRELLAGWGLYEVVSLALGNKKDLGKTHFLRQDAQRIDLVNPLTEEHACLRTNLEESMLDILADNFKKHSGLRDIFEIGRGYWREKDSFKEKDELCMILSFDPSVKSVEDPKEELFLRLKGLIYELLKFLKIADFELTGGDSKDEFDEIKGDVFAWISTNGNRWGYIRLIPREEMDRRDVPLIVASSTLDWETLLEFSQKGQKAVEHVPLPKYPSSKRDLALVVPQIVAYESIEKTIHESAGPLLVDLKLFDIYKGKQIEKGAVSMAFNLTFQDPERTLTDEIVDERINVILKALKENHDVRLRDK